jgi:hypothetical protein
MSALLPISEPTPTPRLDHSNRLGGPISYFRLSGSFETRASQYDWLNRIIAIGIGDHRRDRPIYNVFEMLWFVRRW